MITDVSLGQQIAMVFLIMAAGFLTGLLFDLVRAVSRVTQFPKAVLILTDIFLSVIVAFAVYQVLYMLNKGELRFFVYLSFFLGIIFYYYFCSRYLYKYILNTLKYILRLWQMCKLYWLKGWNVCRRVFGKSGKTEG